MGLLHVSILVMVSDEKGKYVTNTNSRLDLRMNKQRVTYSFRFIRIAQYQLTCMNKSFYKGYPLLQTHQQLILHALILNLAHVLDGFLESPQRLIVISILVDLHLCARIVKPGELLKCLCFRVVIYDGFHNLWIIPPIQILQVVCSKYINLTTPGNTSKEYDLFRVPRSKQTFHCLETISRLGVLLRSEMERLLLFTTFRYIFQ
mmetsp:Transcript_27539/g.44086  ORF Transcript_27539/g.44086 Transcript_27539/m.44086 type:complete len:204 (+) Transcript_27539:182-793(+)